HNCSFAGAAAHDLPIVTTRGPDLEEQFRDGENVLLAPPQDPEALAAAVETVLNDGALRKRLRAGVRTLAREWFTWDKALDIMGLLNSPPVGVPPSGGSLESRLQADPPEGGTPTQEEPS